MKGMSQVLNDKRLCARFLAFCGYQEARVADCVAKRFRLSDEVAEGIAQAAVQEKLQRDAEDAAMLGKHEAAIEAEFNLDRTTWR